MNFEAKILNKIPANFFQECIAVLQSKPWQQLDTGLVTDIHTKEVELANLPID